VLALCCALLDIGRVLLPVRGIGAGAGALASASDPPMGSEQEVVEVAVGQRWPMTAMQLASECPKHAALPSVTPWFGRAPREAGTAGDGDPSPHMAPQATWASVAASAWVLSGRLP